jgi:hypothetical protein
MSGCYVIGDDNQLLAEHQFREAGGVKRKYVGLTMTGTGAGMMITLRSLATAMRRPLGQVVVSAGRFAPPGATRSQQHLLPPFPPIAIPCPSVKLDTEKRPPPGGETGARGLRVVSFYRRIDRSRRIRTAARVQTARTLAHSSPIIRGSLCTSAA